MACSLCLTTKNLGRNCDNATFGGAFATVYMIPFCKVASYTDTGTDGVIDNITLATPLTDAWNSIECRLETVGITEDYTLPGRFVNQQVSFVLENLSDNANTELAVQEVLDFINEIARSAETMIVIVKEANGVSRLFGRAQGLKPSVIQRITGLVATDAAGVNVTLAGADFTYGPVVSATYMATIPLVP